ncbi:hypothetical protein WR25_24455 isoform C [Diploscapter pachys]|uniref:Uncharacterized protein n=1 Tax=Diploscapter pachys TaxID=2018661 RepID=A0A2A2LIX7_9BILA|nr:hypothetical protein WR25_24455 isoform A [Diploscapter pachys]PAV86156.1 hypothetical protein WR25_24455 isoform C [Diploscapter pachys]
MSCFISPPSSSSDEERSPSPPSMMFRTGSGASLASEGLPDGYSPTRLLTLAIQKRRRLYNSKDRDYRAELLQTAFIQSLCKHLGERRAARKKLRAGVSLGEARKRLHQQCVSPVEAADEQPVQKCARLESVPDSPMSPPSSPPRDQDMEEEDPFGLEQFFADLRKKSEWACYVPLRGMCYVTVR